MTLRRSLPVLAAAGLAAVLLAPAATSAYPDAKVESQLRPCFGVLIEPNLKDCKRVRDRWSRHDGSGYGGRDVQHVYCDRNPNGAPIAAALKRVRSGGKIVLHARDRACTESVLITKSVWIESDSGGDRLSGVSLRPPAGKACIRVADGVRDVKLSGLTIDAGQAGAAHCIEARDTDLLITDTKIRYDGEGSAIAVERGRLRFGMGSEVRARTNRGAIDSEGAVLEIADASVRASFVGLDLVPGPGANRIQGLRMRALSDWYDQPAAERSTGAVIRGSGEGYVEFRDSAICGYRTGLWADRGAAVAFLGDKICRAEIGVISEGARIRVQGADIGAGDTGIYAADGVAELFRNRIYGVTRTAVYTDKDAKLWSEDNYTYPYGRKCDELQGGFLRSGVLCRSWDELPAFYLREREPGAGRFDDDRSYFGVDAGWDGGHAKGDYGWRDDWWSRGAGDRDDRGGRSW
jgi:hypothetical protein